MSKLELLNAFLTERLTAAAEEIYRAVKDTVAEYQSEMIRSREENQRLQRLLNVALQRLLLQPESTSVPLQEDHPSHQPEWRRSLELLPNIKEEPTIKDIQPQSPPDQSGQRWRPPAPPSGSSPPPQPSQASESDHHDDDDGDKPFATTTANRRSPLRLRPHADAADALRTQSHASGPGGQRDEDPPRDGDPQRDEDLQRDEDPPRDEEAPSPKPPPPRPPRPNPSMHRWHSCKECGKGFSFACQLEVHMRWHTKEKPYGCGVCRKSFTTVSMLKRHHRIHTGEKPFTCHVCGKSFNQSAHLNTHFRLHTRTPAAAPRRTPAPPPRRTPAPPPRRTPAPLAH